MEANIPFPEKGTDSNALLEMLKSYKKDDAKYDEGKLWCLVYHLNDEFDEKLAEAFHLFFSQNYLNPIVFRSLRRIEHEIVRMGVDLFNGTEEGVGVVTSGGTESILLATKAYRDMARKKKPWIVRPNVVAPDSVHVALDKACHYFGLKLIRVPVGNDFRADMKKMKKAVNINTVMIVGSAPQYVQGVIDPLEELGAFAQKKGIPFHVDACIGGFVLPFMEELGYDLPLFDFRIPGVTSISADIHKYGYAPKGASLLLYKSMEYMRHQFFVNTKWTGGVYAGPNIPGSRPGGPIAAAWMALKMLGKEGYKRELEKVLKTRDYFIEKLQEIPDLEIVAKPQSSLVAYKSTNKKIPIYAVADQLEERGWQADKHSKPEAIHLSFMPVHEKVIDEYLKDLREARDQVAENPELAKTGSAPMYGMMAKVPFRGLIKMSVLKIMEGMFGPNGEVPDLSQPADTSTPMGKMEDLTRKTLEWIDEQEDPRDLLKQKWNELRK